MNKQKCAEFESCILKILGLNRTAIIDVKSYEKVAVFDCSGAELHAQCDAYLNIAITDRKFDIDKRNTDPSDCYSYALELNRLITS